MSMLLLLLLLLLLLDDYNDGGDDDSSEKRKEYRSSLRLSSSIHPSPFYPLVVIIWLGVIRVKLIACCQRPTLTFQR